MDKKTVVIGASPKEKQDSYIAVMALVANNIPVVALGRAEGYIGQVEILKEKPMVENVHTVSMFIGDSRQVRYFDYMLELRPKRIIFNPGTENKAFAKLAQSRQIEVLNGSTFEMLQAGTY